MTTIIQNRQSYRYVGYDYATTGWYFITIRTANFEPLFGEIKNGKMCLNKFGQIAYDEWLNTAKVRDNVTLEEFVVMPDHFHAIVTINFQKNYHNEIGVFRSASQTLGAIVRGYKGAVTTTLKIFAAEHKIDDLPIKIWQRNYYDRIIRDEQELYRIKKYIVDNPKNYIRKIDVL